MELKFTQKHQLDCCLTQDASNWDTYLSQHSDGNFYQRYGWKGINERNFGHSCHYISVTENNVIVGLFPIIFIKSKIFGRILSSMPFVNYGGICSDSKQATERLLEESQKLTVSERADYLEIRSLRPVSDNLPSSLHKISMTLDLDDNPESLWNNFKSKHRTNIRRTYKEGVNVKQGRHDLLDTFYDLMAQSWKNLGTPIYRKSYFMDILDTFPHDTKIFVAYKDDKPIATAFNGYYNGVVEGMWAAALPEYRKIQPNYVLYWEMIKDACEIGYQHFHLGRSTSNSGAESFKKKWNAYSSQLYWQYILNETKEIPQLNVNNPKFKLAIKIWSKLPLKLTTMIGPLVASKIP